MSEAISVRSTVDLQESNEQNNESIIAFNYNKAINNQRTMKKVFMIIAAMCMTLSWHLLKTIRVLIDRPTL